MPIWEIGVWMGLGFGTKKGSGFVEDCFCLAGFCVPVRF